MNLENMKCFISLAECLNFTRAADKEHITQTSMSRKISSLEEELNVRLLERTSRGISLTEAGRVLYDRASRLLDYAHSTAQEVAATGKKHILRLGITSSTVATVLPYISEFSRVYPNVNFEVRDGATFSLLQYLLDGIIDISVARTPLRLEGVDSKILCSEPMIAVSPAGRYPSEDATATLRSLQNRPLILYRRYEELILGEFRRQGLHAEVFCICDDARDAMLWVRAGLATAIFPQSMQTLCEGLDLRILDEPALETQTMLIWKKGVRLPETAELFLHNI